MNALAHALVPAAHRALCLPSARPSEDEPLLLGALAAIDAFVEQPTASRFLVAHRMLFALGTLRRRSTEIERLATRSLHAELGRLAERALLSSEPDSHGADGSDPLTVLRALPPDPRAGRRLQALGALLEAHRALALRVRAPEAHRARLGKPESASESGAPAASRRKSTRTGQPAADRRLRSPR